MKEQPGKRAKKATALSLIGKILMGFLLILLVGFVAYALLFALMLFA